jgi:glycosyltransferase involved in cell wall biosynthesis
MHILLLADGRSPITKSWLKTLQPLGHRISLVSSFPCDPIDGVELAAVLPVAFARFGGSQAGTAGQWNRHKGAISRLRPLLAGVRHALGPWTIPYYQRKFQQVVEALQPDLVHALRIPYEGMVAAAISGNFPLVLSTWGNDFTLHAPANPLMGRLTRKAMARADALLSDTAQDVNRAHEWGFAAGKPALVVVGNGGLDLEKIASISREVKRAKPSQVINPRGLRSYVRSDTFFKSIPLVLAQHPEVQFVCVSMAGQKEALDWVEKLGIQNNVKLMPFLTQDELFREYAKSTISVSISEHDGTPNSLLEAMAFGCLPVCGDLPSIREWITPGVNGALVDPDSPEQAAQTMIDILDNPEKYEKWNAYNQKLIKERADRQKLPGLLNDFYRRVKR